jgi:outer membrane biosynthesis protein TonB
MAETFFSLMSQNSDEESEDSLATEAEDKAVNKSNTTKFLRYTSDDLLKLRANAKNDVLPSDSIVKRINTVGKINTPGKPNTIRNASTMKKHTAMGNAIAMGKSKLAATIGKASTHLTLPQQASSPHRSTKVNPQVTPIQLTITEPDAEQASTKTEPRSGVTQNATSKLEVPQIQVKPKPQTAVVQKVVDEAKVPQIQAKSQSQATTADAKPKTAVTQKTDDQSSSQGETQGKTETSKVLDSPKLRPQAPGFVPAAPATSLSSSEMMLESTQGAGLLVASPLADNQRATPAVMTESLIHSIPSSGQIVAVTPIQFADGHVIPGPSSGLFIIHPAHSLDQMPMQLGTFSADLPIREAESSNAAAHVTKPRKLNKGLTASMWAQ